MKELIKEKISIREEEIEWNVKKKMQYRDEIYDLCAQVTYNKTDMEPHVLVREISKQEQKINRKEEENHRLQGEIRALKELY